MSGYREVNRRAHVGAVCRALASRSRIQILSCLLALSAQDAAQLSEMRYRGGAASYLEVLTNETNYFDAQLGLAQAQLNELAGLVRIYRNLGGGWQQ